MDALLFCQTTTRCCKAARARSSEPGGVAQELGENRTSEQQPMDETGPHAISNLRRHRRLARHSLCPFLGVILARTLWSNLLHLIHVVKRLSGLAAPLSGSRKLFTFRGLGSAPIVSAWLLISACSPLLPAREFDRQALQLSLLRTEVPGHGFMHAVYANGKAPNANGLDVYIGSDGTPWDGDRPSNDPTPRNPLTLRLMASDPFAAIYLGRPCYHSSAAAAGCSARFWTSARYSPEVIDSMEAALEHYLSGKKVDSVRLIGYSGGGSIAVLLAPRLPKVDSVVTIAANLDILAWTEHFAYLPLSESLNPADLPPLAPGIRQLHLVGSRDQNVPPVTIERFRKVQSNAEFRVYENFDHLCCWEREWARLATTFGEDVD